MRLPAIFVTALALSPICCAVRAQTAAERVVSVLDSVCVSPATPDDMMSASEKLAATGGWKLVASAPTPLPIMHNEDGPKLSFTSVWELDLLEGSRATLTVSIVRPAISGVKHSVCVIQPTVAVESYQLLWNVSLVEPYGRIPADTSIHRAGFLRKKHRSEIAANRSPSCSANMRAAVRPKQLCIRTSHIRTTPTGKMHSAARDAN
jgi:hypothetical protein